MRALVYLEWCYARNNAAAILRSPGRLALWGIYGLSLALFGVSRFAGSQTHRGHAPVGITHGIAIAFVGTLAITSGLAIGTAAGGRFAAFRSNAEAILIANAGLRPRTVAVWLQLRRIAGSWGVTLRGFLYVFLLVAPSRQGPLGLARAFIATTLVLGIPQTISLPAFLLARGRLAPVVRAFGYLLAALGAIYVAAGIGGVRFWQPLVHATRIDPALVVGAALGAQPLAFAVPLLLFATFVAIVWRRGNDALPEMYAATKMFAGRRAGREPVVARRPAAGTRRRSERVPPGAGAILWKDWIVLRHNAAARGLFFGATLLWIVCGAAAAAVTRRLDDPAPLGTFALAVGLVILFWAPSSAATGLAGDLAKPLFWLSISSLRTRLAAWTFARTWRGGLAVGCGAGTACLVLGEPVAAAVCLPFATLAYWSLNALGIGMFAAFPNPLDAGGATALLRFVARFAYLVPAGLTAAGVALAHGGLLLSVTVFFVGLGLQGWLAIELVALRFSEHGASLGTLSRSASG